MAILRFPVVVVAFLAEHSRRIPGVQALGRFATAIATGLLVGALVAFLIWGSERAPQRLSLAQLAAGELSPMQSWIIVSGDLRAEPSQSSGFRYRLTDPVAPNASMIVMSPIELPVGQTTVSGSYVGIREAVPAGYDWIGTMRADRQLAPEQPPPWTALILAAAGVVVGTAGRFSYPVFFAERPGRTPPRLGTVPIGVRRETVNSNGDVVSGTLQLRPGESVELRVPGAEAQRLRVHSRYTGLEAGELRRLFGSQPVLRVRQPKRRPRHRLRVARRQRCGLRRADCRRGAPRSPPPPQGEIHALSSSRAAVDIGEISTIWFPSEPTLESRRGGRYQRLVCGRRLSSPPAVRRVQRRG